MLPGVEKLHHIAIICSDYEQSKDFYCRLLGGSVIEETFRAERNSYKLDIRFNGFQIELFSFPKPPKRVSRPEAAGLRHLAIQVKNLSNAISYLTNHGIEVEPVRTDEITGDLFCFFADPDGLPIELVQATKANANQ